MLIAKKGLPFTVEESLQVAAVKKIISAVMEKNPAPVLLAVPLSDAKVKRRVDEMGEYSEEQFCQVLQKISFSLQLHASTISDNNALLMAYVRYKVDEKIIAEILFCAYLETDTIE